MILMRATALDLSLATTRKVYAAGETFEVRIGAADPAQKGVSTKVTLAWLRQIS